MTNYQNHISANSAQWYIRILEGMNIPRSVLLRGTGLGNEWMEKDDTTISLSGYSRIISNALDTTDDESLGLKVGKYIKLSDFGFWGYAIISSRTLAESVDVALQYWKILGIPIKINRKKDRHKQIWEIQSTLHARNSRLWRFQVEEFLSGIYTAACFLANMEIPLERLALSYPEPIYAAAYQELFKCTVSFNEELDAMFFSNSVFEMPTSMGHPQILEACKKQCADISAKLGKEDKLVESVRDIITSSSCRIVEVSEVANMLSISPRTLQRQLRKRKTTFQSILNEVRAEIAKIYLADTTLTTDQISDYIGFTETANFRRAFKKWTGVSPREYRINVVH